MQNKHGTCTTLLSCFLAYIVQGAYGLPLVEMFGEPRVPEDLLDWHELSVLFFIFWQLSFFLLVVLLLIMVLNGLITDKFGEVRTNSDNAKHFRESTCVVCGIGHDVFLTSNIDIDTHLLTEHNLRD